MYAHLSKFLYMLLKVGLAPGTPAAGNIVLYAFTGGILSYKDDAGVVHTVAKQSQLQSDAVKSAVAAGTVDAITATLSPVPTLVDMMRVYIRASGANTVVAPTLNLNGLGALPITKHGGVALAAGDIVGAGHELQLAYRASVPRWELLNPAAAGGGGGGGGGRTLKGSHTLVAAGQTLTVGSLDLATDGGEYDVVLSVKGAVADDYADAYFEADNTNSNYYSCVMRELSGVSGATSNDPRCAYVNNGHCSVFTGKLHIDVDGKVAMILDGKSGTSGMSRWATSMMRNTAGNLTTISIKHRNAAGFAIGSFLKIYKP